MIPLAGHWTGGRRSGVGYYNPKTGIFALRNKLATGPAFRKFRFGPKHMVPLAGSWDGKRWDGVGYYNRWTGTFHLRKRLGRSRAVADRPVRPAQDGPADRGVVRHLACQTRSGQP